ncbi:MAG: thioredoxin family protein [Nigerium sp.]|nr:thioredoxin family protein [Nigerium sp.]
MGWWILGGALLVALAFGGYRRLTDGRSRAVAGDSKPRLDAVRLGDVLGTEATFVQFSSAVCAPCRATHRLLTEVTRADPAVAHIDIDAEARLDLVDEFGIMRTPTVLLLDAGGVVRHRIVGAPRRADVVEALRQVTHSAAA